MLAITHHAYKRAKKRCGLKKKSLYRIATKAFENGLSLDDLNGGLYVWAAGVYCIKHVNPVLRIYGEYLFIIDNYVLITIYSIPNEFKKTVRDIMDKKRNK